MERAINGKIPRVRTRMSRYLSYNKISNMIYMVNYNLVSNIVNSSYIDIFIN